MSLLRPRAGLDPKPWLVLGGIQLSIQIRYQDTGHGSRCSMGRAGGACCIALTGAIGCPECLQNPHKNPPPKCSLGPARLLSRLCGMTSRLPKFAVVFSLWLQEQINGICLIIVICENTRSPYSTPEDLSYHGVCPSCKGHRCSSSRFRARSGRGAAGQRHRLAISACRAADHHFKLRRSAHRARLPVNFHRRRCPYYQ